MLISAFSVLGGGTLPGNKFRKWADRVSINIGIGGAGGGLVKHDEIMQWQTKCSQKFVTFGFIVGCEPLCALAKFLPSPVQNWPGEAGTRDQKTRKPIATTAANEAFELRSFDVFLFGVWGSAILQPGSHTPAATDSSIIGTVK